MTFRVVLRREALNEALEAAAYIAEQASPETARAWYDGFESALLSLQEHPHRCGYARENKHLRLHELRQLLYKSHRVIFVVIDDEAHVLRVRHQRQDELPAIP